MGKRSAPPPTPPTLPHAPHAPQKTTSTTTTNNNNDNKQQATCNNAPSTALPDLSLGGGAPFRPSLSCGSVLRLPWALLAVEALVLVGAALSLCLGGLAHAALSWLAAFAILSAVCVFVADALVALQSTPVFGGGGNEGDRARLTQAGFVPLAALNALLAFWLGWRQQHRRDAATSGTAALPVKY